MPAPRQSTVQRGVGARAPGTDMESTISERREPDPWVLAVVEKAMRKGHRISDCPDCRGPRIHSKRRKGSWCVGCGRRWETSVIVLGKRTCDAVGNRSRSRAASPAAASSVAGRWLASRRRHSTGRRTGGSRRSACEIQTASGAKRGDSIPLPQNAFSGSKQPNVYRGLWGSCFGVRDRPKAPGRQRPSSGRCLMRARGLRQELRGRPPDTPHDETGGNT